MPSAFIDIGDPRAPVGSPPWCKYAHGTLCEGKRRTDSEVARLKYGLIEFKKFERWKQLTDKKGRPFRSWEDYLQYPEPDGLGIPAVSAKLIMEELDDKRLLGDVLGQHGGDRKSEQAKDQVGNTKLISAGGTTRDYILARLDRDGHDELATKVRAGKLSANAAAIEAGFRKQQTPMDHATKAVAKLSDDEWEGLKHSEDERRHVA
jgi:hypothetical protein